MKNLHGMWREGSYPPKRHAAPRVVTVFCRVVIVPLRLTPGREWKRIRLASIAGPVPVRERPRQILGTGSRPNPTEVRLAVRKAWRGGGHVHLCYFCGLRSGRRRQDGDQYDCRSDQTQTILHGVFLSRFLWISGPFWTSSVFAPTVCVNNRDRGDAWARRRQPEGPGEAAVSFWQGSVVDYIGVECPIGDDRVRAYSPLKELRR